MQYSQGMELNTKCVDCRCNDQTKIEAVIHKNGLVQFRVDCRRCGGFSHFLPYTELNQAVKDLVGELNAIRFGTIIPQTPEDLADEILKGFTFMRCTDEALRDKIVTVLRSRLAT